jgi:hypothetical protein
VSDTPTDLACHPDSAPLADRALFAIPTGRAVAQHLADTYCRHCAGRDWCAGEQRKLGSPGVWAGQWFKPSLGNRGRSTPTPVNLLGEAP